MRLGFTFRLGVHGSTRRRRVVGLVIFDAEAALAVSERRTRVLIDEGGGTTAGWSFRLRSRGSLLRGASLVDIRAVCFVRAIMDVSLEEGESSVVEGNSLR